MMKNIRNNNYKSHNAEINIPVDGIVKLDETGLTSVSQEAYDILIQSENWSAVEEEGKKTKEKATKKVASDKVANNKDAADEDEEGDDEEGYEEDEEGDQEGSEEDNEKSFRKKLMVLPLEEICAIGVESDLKLEDLTPIKNKMKLIKIVVDKVYNK